MASSENIRFENLVELTDIDIDMEVKSECDSDEENNCNRSFDDDRFDVEFIIPERQTPIESALDETLLNPDSVTRDSTPDYSEESDSTTCDSSGDENIEDEPEVELDEIAVRQELVEVALDPSSLFYVKHDKKPPVNQKERIDQPSVQLPNVDEPEQLLELSVNTQQPPVPEKSVVDGIPLSTSLLQSLDNGFLSLPTPNARSKGSAVTAALRQVKRKPIREPLEPLIENECSSNNMDYLKNVNGNKFDIQIDKLGNEVSEEKNKKRRDCDSESDDEDEKVFSDPPSPCFSDSESKEQKDTPENSPAITKRKRGRPRIKPLDFRERNSVKRTHKRKKVRKKVKVKKKSSISKDMKLKKDVADESTLISEKLSSTVAEVAYDLTKAVTECGLNNNVNESSVDIESDKSTAENCKKGRKPKKVKKKPSIFDEVKMDYTILNGNEPKEKPKRIRRRDKKSRELAALNKPESFDCTECGRQFKEKSHLATHARAHIDIRNFKCNRCGNLFKTKTSLFFHMKTHSDAPFTCEKCNKTYPERRMLMRHIRVVHSSQNLYSCDQCGREFKSMNNLNLHYTLHTGVKPFTCNHCGKSFVYKSTYIAHMKGHDADNLFNCELCPKTYNNKAEFRRLCNHHSEARPWLCTVCGKGYPLKGTLKNHMKTHEPEKPFKCPECPKSFMKKQSFECHLKIHAGESPQFMCDQCSQSYFNVFALKRHYLKHTSERKFVCEVCSKAFWMKDALKVHMRTHSSVKMFPCLQCPKAFAHKHTLDAHSRTHLDVQPYSCNVCQKTFIHKYNLARHERQHLLGSSMPVMPSSILPQVPQPIPISLMMLPPSPTSTTLHIL